jgi:uncharacterized protein
VATPRTVPTGVGLGLRFPFLRDAAQGVADGRVAFFEITPENYLSRGDAVRTQLAAVAERIPLLSHGLSLSLGGSDPLDLPHARAVGALLRELGVPFHSDHLCTSAEGGVQLHDLLPIPLSEAWATHTAERVLRAQDALGLPLHVENITYYAHVAEPELPEHAFITRVLQRSGAGLLLDLNNLHVNALNFGFDARALLDQLPLACVAQIHVAGPDRWPDGVWVDTHGSAVPDAVRALLFEAVRRIGPVPVLLERDHALPSLPALLDEVAELDDVYQAALAVHEARHVA